MIKGIKDKIENSSGEFKKTSTFTKAEKIMKNNSIDVINNKLETAERQS